MKHFFKRLFSRFSFVALTIILMFTVGFFVAVGGIALVNYLIIRLLPESAAYVQWTVNILTWGIVVIAVLHAANRDMLPETKVPWILCIVALNVFGVAIYATFSANRPSKRVRKRFEGIKKRSARYTRRTLGREETEQALGRWAATSEALYTVNPAAVLRGNTKTEYLSSGERYISRLIGDLKRAEKYIFLEYFIIGKGKVWRAILSVLRQKVKEGVEVRVIYDDIGCMGRVHVRYHKTLRKMGIDCVKFNPFVPVVANIHNNRDHRKIVVIDGRIAYTGGINLADEYANLTHPYGHWKDSGVRLEGEGVINFIVMFLRMYGVQTGKKESFKPYLAERYEKFVGEGYVQPYSDGPGPLYGRQIGEDVYINVVNTAKRYVYVTTPYLIIDYRMREALVLAAQRGVDVRILTPRIPDKKVAFALTRSNYAALIRGGVKIYEYTPGFVHAKSFLADGEAGVVGTVNLDYRSFLFHFEDAVFMYRTAALEGLKADMDAMFSVSELQTLESAKRSLLWRAICQVAKIFAPLF